MFRFKQGNWAATFTYSGSINNYNITFCNFEDNKGVQTNANTQKKRDIVRKEIWTTQTDSKLTIHNFRCKIWC